MPILLPKDDAEDVGQHQRKARLASAADLIETAGDERAKDGKTGAGRQGPPDLSLCGEGKDQQPPPRHIDRGEKGTVQRFGDKIAPPLPQRMGDVAPIQRQHLWHRCGR
jgi:hypothetical protein